MKVGIVARVLNLHELRQDLLPPDLHALLQVQQHAVIDLGGAQAINAGHGGDDDNVVPLEQRPRGRVPHLIDRVIDGRIFGNIGVGLGKVCLRLVIIIIAHEIFDGVVGKKLPEFLVELTGQRLVVDQDQRRLLDAGDQVRHREGLARAGHPEQHVVPRAGLHPGGELLNRLGLIPTRRELGFQFERHQDFSRRSS